MFHPRVPGNLAPARHNASPSLVFGLSVKPLHPAQGKWLSGCGALLMVLLCIRNRRATSLWTWPKWALLVCKFQHLASDQDQC